MRVVFYGSSTVSGAGIEDPANRFSSIVSRELGWDEVNLGIPESLVTGRDLDAQIVSQRSGVVRVPDIFDEKPDLVVVLYGADDVAAGKILGAPDDFRPGTFSSDYDSMVRGIAGGCGGEKIVLMTIEFATRAGAEHAASHYNDAIRKIANRYGIALFDGAALIENNQEVFTLPAEAPFALGVEGQKLLAAEFKTRIRELLKQED
jgi:hypothetical protein